ncbi:hypothetical protein ACFYKX_25460 [Cytobacillus sp. FJAT-54145]|uniref:Uncharacterized protein n=1 Tax=Cytobacillus spartinae TaxID=3299023 RepID=A0ABW6KIA6_9BACI
MKKSLISISLAFTILGTSFLQPQMKVSASATTPLPEILETEPVRGGPGVTGFLVDVGARKGTLVFKIENGSHENKQWANHLMEEYALDFYITKGPEEPGAEKQIGSFNNFFNDDTLFSFGKAPTGKGDNYFIGGVNYLDKVYDVDGEYFFYLTNAQPGYFKLKAYFYPNVNVKDKVIKELERYFPLLDMIRWDKAELKAGQIGRLTILEKTTLWKEQDGQVVKVRNLNPKEQYRIYSYSSKHGGEYGVGAGHFITKDPKVKYESPNKYKMELLRHIYE